jgi:hypothetical protein
LANALPRWAIYSGETLIYQTFLFCGLKSVDGILADLGFPLINLMWLKWFSTRFDAGWIWEWVKKMT